MVSINFPNKIGIACDFKDSIFDLKGRSCDLGLPEFLSSYFYVDTDTLTKISEKNIQNKSILIYPNPFSSTSTVEILNQNIESIKYINASIYDVIGNENKIGYSIKNSNKNVKLNLNAGNLSSGIYILKITLNENIYFQKIIIE